MHSRIMSPFGTVLHFRFCVKSSDSFMLWSLFIISRYALTVHRKGSNLLSWNFMRFRHIVWYSVVVILITFKKRFYSLASSLYIELNVERNWNIQQNGNDHSEIRLRSRIVKWQPWFNGGCAGISNKSEALSHWHLKHRLRSKGRSQYNMKRYQIRLLKFK